MTANWESEYQTFMLTGRLFFNIINNTNKIYVMGHDRCTYEINYGIEN